MVSIHKVIATSMAVFIFTFTQPAYSKYFKLECEIRNYGANYTVGEGREAAESWFPQKSTHIIYGNRSYHMEYERYGFVRQRQNRIYFQYSSESTNGTESTVKYTYLSKRGNLNGILHTPPGYWDIQVYGRCDSYALSKSKAEEYLK